MNECWGIVKAEEDMRSGVARDGQPGLAAFDDCRFDAEVLAAFRATGKGWQTRMNEALRDWLRSHPHV